MRSAWHREVSVLTIPGQLTRRRPRADRPLRVAVVAESFSPAVNGVTNSVLRVNENLRLRGHEPVVIAPGPGPDEVEGTPVLRMRAFDLPRYDALRVGVPMMRIHSALREIRPDLVHLAAPAVLGALAARAARLQRVPSIAVYQTDVAGFARRHGLRRLDPAIWAWIRWVHGQAARTLAPSTVTMWALRHHGIADVHRWGRGVDLERFDPRHRDQDLRRRLAPRGEVIVGFVGRLAREKQVERLRTLARTAGIRVVIVGDGPERPMLQRLMPHAEFLGARSGAELSRLHASFDVFVHTGIDETFCQAVQEALASGVPVVAPAAGGPMDLVHHGVNGFLWTPASPESLDAAVHHIVGDRELRWQMAGAARASVIGRPWSSVVDDLIAHYRDVVLPVRHENIGVAPQPWAAAPMSADGAVA